MILQSIKGKEVLITELNERIIDLIEEDKISEDVEEATEFEIKVKKNMSVIEEFLQNIRRALSRLLLQSKE